MIKYGASQFFFFFFSSLLVICLFVRLCVFKLVILKTWPRQLVRRLGREIYSGRFRVAVSWGHTSFRQADAKKHGRPFSSGLSYFWLFIDGSDRCCPRLHRVGCCGAEDGYGRSVLGVMGGDGHRMYWPQSLRLRLTPFIPRFTRSFTISSSSCLLLLLPPPPPPPPPLASSF